MPKTAEPAAQPEPARPKGEFNFCLDDPSNWTHKLRRLRLSGWAVANNGGPLTGIRARLDRRIFPGEFNRERPDVVKQLENRHLPTRCGFTIELEVPRGRHRLEVEVSRADGQWRKVFARGIFGPWRITSTERASRGEEEARLRYEFFVDRPSDWSKPSRKLYISGWCFDRTGAALRGVRAQVGKRKFAGNYGISRVDIAPKFPQSKTALLSGFALAATVPPGDHVLSLEVKGSDGLWRRFLSQKVIGAPRGKIEEKPVGSAELFEPRALVPSRFSYWLDEPKDWSECVRYLRISGWCVAVTGPATTDIRARLRGRIFRAHHGIHRPDVALSFRGKAGLWSGFAIDLLVPWRHSTLFLEARTDGGPWEIFFARRVRGPAFWARQGPKEEVGNYLDWIYLHERLTRGDVTQIRKQIAGFSKRPLFSLLLPAYNSNARWLRRAIVSVQKQLYQNWELCIVDDASSAPHVWQILQQAAQRDARIKILRRDTNGHICAASNDALALATGEFVGLLDHDDELAPTALYHAALALNRRAGLQLIYSDEDKIDGEGTRRDPYFKSDWNPDLLTSQNYVSHFSIYATDLVRKVGGFRASFEGSQDYDLILRCAETLRPGQIHHIPRILYHWRIDDESTASFPESKPYARDAAVRALQEHVDRGPVPGRAALDYMNYLRVTYATPTENPLVSIIIPTRDQLALLRRCIESIRDKTDYANFEIIVVDNDSREGETLDYLASLAATPNARVLRVPGEFNFSKLNNLAVAEARGTYLGLLNNDLEIINRDWLREMLSHAARPGIGAVGARLWYPDGRLQHGGVLLGVGGIANHAHRLLRAKDHGYFARARLTQNFSAVTGACMVLRKNIYEEAGGLDEANLPVAFNDVDFCLRLRERNLLIVWTPYAELIHHESISRGFEDTAAKQERFMSEVAYMEKRWGHLLKSDPYYSPNFSVGIEQQFTLAFPPHLEKPWADA